MNKPDNKPPFVCHDCSAHTIPGTAFCPAHLDDYIAENKAKGVDIHYETITFPSGRTALVRS